jgi:2-succinyl-5-enolpyruvyl-6-hydroxy-3-cyclohexene-1-carboxylate synthase
VSRNTIWAEAFIGELARAGVREVCVAPGSRSTPLVMAAARAEDLRVFTHVDERSAGFFALGMGKATGRPAAVITTSGTAAANLYPAVIEAHQSESPLIVLTADRPHRLRDADANQAIDQLRLFGTGTRAFFEMSLPVVEAPSLRHLRAVAARAVAESVGAPAGAVHVNFPFEKPLEPVDRAEDVPPGFRKAFPLAADGRAAGRPFTRVSIRRAGVDRDDLARVVRLLRGCGRVLLVAGPSVEPDRVGSAVLRFAAAAAVPVLADPLSGARFRPHGGAAVVGGYDLFLRSPSVQERLAPEVILRVGQTPTSSALAAFLDRRPGAHQVVLDGGQLWKDHLATAHEYLRADPADFLDALSGVQEPSADRVWGRLWTEAERVTRDVVARELEGELFEGTILNEVSQTVPGGTTLFVSSSMPIRDMDGFGCPRSDTIRVLGNRGASGIDGIVSTALGIAAVAQGRVIAVLGDLAFYHDMNGLLAARKYGLEVVFVVINNDGGGIFHMLPIRSFEPAFTEHFAAPHGLDFAHAASLYGLPHDRAETRDELRGTLEEALGASGCRIVEVRSDRERNRERHMEVTAAVRGAVEALLSS